MAAQSPEPGARVLNVFDVRSNFNLEMFIFMEGGKPENPEKNPRSKAATINKLNPYETTSTGIEPGAQRWKTRGFPLRQPCSPKAR